MNHLHLCYPAIFHPEEDGYSVSVPDLESAGYGCYTQGDSFDEACTMAFDAVGLCLEDLLERGLAIPAPSRPEDLKKDGRDFVVPIAFDMAKYMQRHRNQSVKKTLSIPAWLNDLAEEKHINFSKLLKTALANELGVTL